jgi:hypothetical protein
MSLPQILTVYQRPHNPASFLAVGLPGDVDSLLQADINRFLKKTSALSASLLAAFDPAVLDNFLEASEILHFLLGLQRSQILESVEGCDCPGPTCQTACTAEF